MCWSGDDGKAGVASMNADDFKAFLSNESIVREYEEARNALLLLDKFMARYLNRIDANPELGNILFQKAFERQAPLEVNEISTHTKASLRTSHTLMRLVLSDAIGVFKIHSGMAESGTIRDLGRESIVRSMGTEQITNLITREAQSKHLDAAMKCCCDYQAILAFGPSTDHDVPEHSVPTWDEGVIANNVLSDNQSAANYRGENADIEALNEAKDRAEASQ